MKPRVALLLALAGLGLLVWMFSGARFKEVTVPAQLRGEAARNPFYGAIQFSRALGADARWEQMFTEPARDSVLVLSGWNWNLSRARREQIERWVEDGGRLVVDSWLLGDTEGFEQWSGIYSQAIGDNEDVDVDDDFCREIAESTSERTFSLCQVDFHSSLTTSKRSSWALRDGERTAALRVPLGRGSVTMINGQPFRHRAFLMGDHMKIFLAATQLRRDDAVLFLTEDEQTSLLTLVWRFGAPAVLLLLAAVVFGLWRAGVRFGPRVAATDTARRSLAEQIRGTGQFVVRFGGGRALVAAANRALRTTARRRINDFERLSSEARVAAIARATGVDADTLGHAMNFSGERNSHELRHAIAVLETARRQLASRRSGNGN